MPQSTVADSRTGPTRCLAAGAVLTVSVFLALGSALLLVDPSCGGPADSWRCGAPGHVATAGVVMVTVTATALALRACRVAHPSAVAALSLLSLVGLFVSYRGALPGQPVLPMLTGTGWAWTLGPGRSRPTPWVVGAALGLLMAAGLALTS